MDRLEELKKRLNKNIKQEKVKDSSIESFIDCFNIKTGSYKLETFVLYHLYLKHCRNLILSMSRIDFFRKLCKHIPTKRYGKQRYYLISREDILLSEEDEMNIKLSNNVKYKKKVNL